MVNADAERRLRANIKKVGLVGPALVWNKRTKTLVSGHLRLGQIDVLEGHDDYTLDMTVVDWPERKEKQQNVFMNNPWAQGQFDLEALGNILAADMPGLEEFGMDVVEIQHLFPGDERFGELFADLDAEDTSMPDAKRALDEIEGDKDQAAEERKAARAEEKKRRTPEEMVAERAEYGKILDAANATDFYVIVVCKDGAQCARVMSAFGTAEGDSRYVSAEVVLGALGVRG